jgi:hypothetical protein
MLQVNEPGLARAASQTAVVAGAGTHRSRWNPGVCAFVFALGVLFLTMPAFFYPGDNFTPRAEAAHFLMTGEFGIPLSRRAELSEFVENRGSYFIENDVKGRFFSKYGVAYTLLDLPPLALEKSIAGKLELIHKSGSLVWLLNFYNLLFAAIILVYLFQLTGLYSDRAGLRALFLVCSCFGTFLWYYLRCHAHDIFQIAAFLAFFYHAICFIRQRRAAAADQRGGGCGHLLAASVFLGCLIHMRFSYALLYVPLWAIALLGEQAGAARQRTTRRPTVVWHKGYLGALVLPTVVAIGLLLFVQDWKFESPFNNGYQRVASQNIQVVNLATGRGWRVGGGPHVLYQYFVKPGNANAFIHYPLLGIALFGWLSFWRKYRLESLFYFVVAGCILLPLLGMGSEGYGYGPRYLLPVLIVCSLPALEVMRRVGTLRPPLVRYASMATMAGVLAWSCAMQVYVNSLPFFTFHHLRDKTFMPLVAGTPAEEAMRRCFQPIHIGLFHRELLACRREGTLPPAGKLALEVVPARHRQAAESRLRAELLRYTAPNYGLYWILTGTRDAHPS